MTYYAVIDTNVIVSALLNPDSIPGSVLKYALSGIIVPLVNDEIIKEYKEVLCREQFGFNKEDIDIVLSEIVEKAIFLQRTTTTEVFIDKSDIVFYEIALTGNSKTFSYLITGNLKHFPKKMFVVSPKEMIDIINSV